MSTLQINHKVIRLQNGSRLIFIPLPYARLVTLMAVVNAGPRFDPEDKAGLSHFIEHLKLRGSFAKDKAKPSLFDIEQYGSSPDGFTYFETNKYWTNLMPECVIKGAEFLCQILKNKEYSLEDLETERKTISEELRIVKSNPEKQIWETWTNHIFSGSNLAKSYIGDPATFGMIGRDDVQHFLEEMYIPERVTFILSGNDASKSVGDIAKLIDRTFKYRMKPEPIEKSQLRHTTLSNKIVVEKSSVQTLNVMLGFSTVSIKNSRCYVFQVIKSYLNGGLSSVFGHKLMLRGLVYFIHSLTVHLSDNGYFSVHFTSLPNNLNIILRIIYKEIELLKLGQIDPKRLESAKVYTVFQQRLQLNNPHQIADYFAKQFPFGDYPLVTPDNEEKIVRSVTQSDISEAAKEFFTPQTLKIAIIGDIDKNAVSIDL